MEEFSVSRFEGMRREDELRFFAGDNWREHDKFYFQGGVIMVTLRRLAIFSFLALLTGCWSPPCKAPFVDEEPTKQNDCFYKIQVTEIDPDNYFVKGHIPAEIDQKGSVTKWRQEVHTFRVRDLDKLAKQMKVNGEYEFMREGSSPYLELLPPNFFPRKQ